MSTIAELCNQLIDAYEAKGLLVRHTLRPPLDAGQVERLAAAAKVQLAPELVELYGWHDGAAPGSGFRFAGKAFLPLEQALSRREALMETLHPKDRQNTNLSQAVPFAELEPEWLALAGNTEDGFRPVLEVLEDARPAYDSLSSMLATCIEWVGEPDWSPETPPARAEEIWFGNNRGDL